jgi:hypothetical protein
VKAMTDNLFFIEKVTQVNGLIQEYKNTSGTKKIIALSPFAMHELDKKKISYRIPEDYYKSEELYELGLDNYTKVEEICSFIDNEFKKKIPEYKSMGLKPAFYNLYGLKIIYDALTIRLAQLYKILEMEEPKRLFFTRVGLSTFQPTYGPSLIMFNNNELLYSALLELFEGDYKLKELPILEKDAMVISKVPTEERKSFKKNLSNWLESHPSLFKIAKTVTSSGLKEEAQPVKRDIFKGKVKSIILLGSGYNWSIETLKRAGVSNVQIVQDDLDALIGSAILVKSSKDLKDLSDTILKNKNFIELFNFNDKNFLSLLEDRLKFIIEILSKIIKDSYIEAEQLIEKESAGMVLGSSITSCKMHAYAQAGRDRNIPVILWQHGSYGYFDWYMWRYNELKPSDVFLVFGSGEQNKTKEMANQYKTRVVQVGSHALDNQYFKRLSAKTDYKLNLDPDRKTVLYVTNAYYQNLMYVSMPPLFSDNKFWKTQRAIMDTFKKYDNYNYIIKTHQNPIMDEAVLRTYSEDTNFNNCVFIRNETTFTNLLPAADIIIIDLPTTTLLQSLTTSKAIFCYTGHLTFDEKAIKLIDKRAYRYNKLDDFISNLDAFFSKGRLDRSVDLRNNEFLLHYGMHKIDGKSHIRVIDYLKTQTEGSK